MQSPDIVYYKDFNSNDGTSVAFKNKSILYMKLVPEKDRQLLWFYLEGVGMVDHPLVINNGVKMEQLIEMFMRKDRND